MIGRTTCPTCNYRVRVADTGRIYGHSRRDLGNGAPCFGSGVFAEPEEIDHKPPATEQSKVMYEFQDQGFPWGEAAYAFAVIALVAAVAFALGRWGPWS